MRKYFNTLTSFEFEALRHSGNYKQWIWDQFGSVLNASESILEVGSGVGQFTTIIHDNSPAATITALEPSTSFFVELTEKLPNIERINQYSEALIGSRVFDTIININVLEHIENDTEEIKNWHSLLNSGGKACVLVPALNEIYAPIDNLMGHYRRYTKQELASKFEAAGFRIERISYFNFIGYWLWLLNFKLLKNTTFSAAKVTFNDRYLIHLCKALDALGANYLKGQSVVCIAQKI